MKDLAVVIPTRRRWWWLKQQIAALAPQLADEDRVVFVVDNDEPDPEAAALAGKVLGEEHLISAVLSYRREQHPVGCINRARNAAVCLLPRHYAIVEADDHDVLEPYALSEMRMALEAGADYVFGGYRQLALIECPDGRFVAERWNDVTGGYAPGDFAAGRIDAIGVRAMTRDLWDALGGWSDVWPCGDKDFAVRAERRGSVLVRIEQPLCTVLVNEPDSLSYKYRGATPIMSTQTEAQPFPAEERIKAAT